MGVSGHGSNYGSEGWKLELIVKLWKEAADTARVQEPPTPLRSMRVRPCALVRAPREAAFTLIELIVAMILLTIALGIVGGVVMQSISGSGSARSGGISDAAVARASTMLGDDVGKAMTQARRDNKVRDPADLAAAVRRNEPAISSDPADNSARVDIDDVIMATSTELRLRADVDRTAGVECVQWLARTTGSKFILRRRVDRQGAACGGGRLSDLVVLQSDSAAASLVDTTPFSYRLMCRRGTCPGSSAPASSPCRPWSVASVPANKRRWVIGVDANLGAVTEERSAAAATGELRSSIRSREVQTWREALGC